jgi:hypothetical protein
MAAHHWQDIEPPAFFAEAFCERCGLRRHVLALERAVFVEEGAKRSWHPLPPPCPPPPPGPEDGSRPEDAAEEAFIERALRGEFDWMLFGLAGPSARR